MNEKEKMRSPLVVRCASLSLTLLWCLLLALAPSLKAARAAEDQAVQVSARELMREVARNEERSYQNPRSYYKYVEKTTTPKGSETSIQIETPYGKVSEVISKNGKPPSQERCQSDSNSLKKLAADPQAQKRRLREQKQDADRLNKLIASVPEAFIFQYDGKQKDSNLAKIKFRPDPQFEPHSHEVALLKGMRGIAWVDPSSRRLVKIEGTLVKDVNFGWGFLASFHRGGHFVMQQSKISGGIWKQTFLQVDFDGTKLLFGQLHVHFKEWSQSFDRLPDHPTLAQAVNMLEHAPDACGGKQSLQAVAKTLKPHYVVIRQRHGFKSGPFRVSYNRKLAVVPQ